MTVELAVLILALLGGGVLVFSYRGYRIRKRAVQPPPRLDGVILELRGHQDALRKVTDRARADGHALDASDDARVEHLRLDAEVRMREHR